MLFLLLFFSRRFFVGHVFLLLFFTAFKVMFKSQCTYWMDRITTQQATASASVVTSVKRVTRIEWKSIDFRINLNIFTTTHLSICSIYDEQVNSHSMWLEERKKERKKMKEEKTMLLTQSSYNNKLKRKIQRNEVYTVQCTRHKSQQILLISTGVISTSQNDRHNIRIRDTMS